MACSTCLCEWLLGVLNVLIMLVGLAIAAIGAVLQAAAGSTFFKFLETSIKSILNGVNIVGDKSFIGNIDFQSTFGSAAIILIIVGGVIACIAFIGWCSNCCGGYNVLRILYTVILAILVVAQVVVVALFFSKVFDSTIKTQVTNLINDQYVDLTDSGLPSIIMNVIMLNYQCCGLNGYQDFNTSKKWNSHQNLTLDGKVQQVTLVTPVACCATTGKFPDVELKDDWCAVYPNNDTSNWDTGCWTAVTTDLDQYRTWAILVASGIIVIQAIIMVLVIGIIKANEK
jgi:hypothetical protein